MTERYRVNRIKLLLVCHDGSLYGSQRSLLLLLKSLPASRYECYVSLARLGPLKLEIEAMAREQDNIHLLWHRRISWMKHDVRSPVQKLSDGVILAFNSLFRVWDLIKHIERYNIDWVHTNSVVSLEGALAAKLTKTPHIWHIRELFMGNNPKLNTCLGKPFTRWLIVKLSQKIVCISQAVQQQFEQNGQLPSACVLLSNAVNTDAISPKIKRFSPQKPFVIGYVGRLSLGKRFHDLLEAVLALSLQQYPVQLHVAGDFSDERYRHVVMQTIKQAQCPPETVQFLGYQAQVSAFYQNIHTLVLPSEEEPFGRVLIEAMAHGVVCIGADSGGIPEIISHQKNGYLYPVRHVQALVKVLKRVMRQYWASPSALTDLRRRASLEVRERYSMVQHSARLEALYQKPELVS